MAATISCRQIQGPQDRQQKWQSLSIFIRWKYPGSHTHTEKDLGVTSDCELKFWKHIDDKSIKQTESWLWSEDHANTLINAHSADLLFKGLVRPHLEYTVSVWNPLFLKRHYKTGRCAKKRATKEIHDLKDNSYYCKARKFHMQLILAISADEANLWKLKASKFVTLVMI